MGCCLGSDLEDVGLRWRLGQAYYMISRHMAVSMGALRIRALLFWVYVRTPDSWKLPHGWVAVKELKLRYHNPKTILFTMFPCYGNLSEAPLQHPNSNPDGKWKAKISSRVFDLGMKE